MKKCLLILPRDIFPINCGYSLKNQALIKSLSEKYRLTIILISDKGLSEDGESFYNNYSENFHFYKFSKWHFLFNVTISLFTKIPMQIGYYHFRKVQKKIDSIINDFDIAIGALIRTYYYIYKANSGCVNVFDMVDSIGLNYLSSKRNVESIFWEIIYNIETPRLLNYEKKFIRHSDVTYLFNPNEVDFWKQEGNVRWLPHGVNSELFSYDLVENTFKEYVAFIGKMDYRPNIDAVEWYVKNIHLNLKKRKPLIIVGANPVDSIKKLSSDYDDVIVTGFVEDPYIYLNSSSAVIAPMQTGGGIQNKVLEAMALGKVVIMSSLAAAPIKGGNPEKHYLIANQLNDYDDAFEKLKDHEACAKIMKNAKKLIEDVYTWDNYSMYYIQGIESQMVVAQEPL